MSTAALWIGFNIFVLIMLALDLGVFHRRAHVVEVREALKQSALWIMLALSFNVVVYFWQGPTVALEFLTGYLIEKSLSVDNIFVFLVVFSYFGVNRLYQHKVLFWGIIGALVMRAALIVVGAALIERFHWIIYVFGAFLIFTGIRLAFSTEGDVHPERNPVVKLFRRFFPVTPDYQEGNFFVRMGGRRFATPLFIVLIVVETTDLLFALDSIPAIFAITHDPFIVYTSNVFAILGLRALFFALAGIMGLFHYLKYGLSIVLAFVGLKMVMSEIYKIPIGISLAIIAGILIFSVVLSILRPQPASHVLPTPEGGEGDVAPHTSKRPGHA